MISLAGKLNKLDVADALYEEMEQRGVPRTTEVENALMVAHARNFDCPKALELFQRIRDSRDLKPNLVTFNSALSAYSKLRDVNNLEKTFQELVEAECRPSLETFNCLILGYQRVGMWWRMEQVFSLMKAVSCKPNAFTFRTLIRGYTAAKLLDRMEAVFEEMLKEGISLRTLTAEVMVSAYDKARDLEKMEKIFDMVKSKGSHLRVNKLMLRSYAYNGRVDDMEALIDEAMRKGEVLFSPRLAEAVIKAYLKQGAYERVDRFLERANAAGWNLNRSLFNTLIFSHGKAGHFDKMEQCFSKMLASGCRPNLRTFRILSKAYQSGNRKEEVCQVLNRMKLAGFDVPEDSQQKLLGMEQRTE